MTAQDTHTLPESRSFPRDLVILMYHHCADAPRDAVLPGLYVTPRQFAWQVDWLIGKGASFCTFEDLEQKRAGMSTGPLVMLTFDDGFRDVYENAWPILSARRVSAVVYPVVGDIGKTGVVWPENTDRSPQSLLTQDQIRELAAGGIEFGSHLWDHRRASKMETDELRRQLSRSKEELGRILGHEPLSIAYPFGAYSDKVVEETRRAGYRYGVTTHEGSNKTAPMLELNRYAVRGTRLHHRWRFSRIMRQALSAAA